ncbi:hypothetical protein Salat_2546800 [Sesamum alatum]|uniref:Uncharacterized protein n=1 Tax=Sesamum alatum TaxID=300844 RepID=A0AAE2CCN2_9LAMI|nr:hypothetical protein Salat_2546800 [Sesamum alatum]
MVDNRFELINEDKELVSLCLASQYSREVNLYMDGELHFINVMGSQVGFSNIVNERAEENRGPEIRMDETETNLVDVRVGGVQDDLTEGGSEDTDSDYNVDMNDEHIHGEDDGLFMENIDPDVEWRGDGDNLTPKCIGEDPCPRMVKTRSQTKMVAESTMLPQPVPAASLPPRPGPSTAIFCANPKSTTKASITSICATKDNTTSFSATNTSYTNN